MAKSTPWTALYAFCFWQCLRLVTANVSQKSQDSYQPVAYHLGKGTPKHASTGFQRFKPGSCHITLDSASPVVTLDYGAEVAGFPYVEISSLAGDAAQVEMKYSEPFDGLDLPYGDGPWCVFCVSGARQEC